MSTNYYARILPTKERKERLKEFIDNNDFKKIQDEVADMYGRYQLGYEGEPIGGQVHLGKRASGWKFLWNPNCNVIRHGHMEWEDTSECSRIGRWVPEDNTMYYLYPLTKEGIKAFIDREDVVIYDEYGDKQDKEEFWNMALNWSPDGFDSKSYEEKEIEKNGTYKTYPISGELTDMLMKEGYTFTSNTHSDFYSDGLRFAGFIDFS